MNRAEFIFWKAISYIMIPPVTALIAFQLLLKKNNIEDILTILTGIFLIFVCPVILFIVLRFKGIIKDNDASEKRERNIPFISGIIFYLTGYFLFNFCYDINVIDLYWITLILILILNLVINRYWKISSHLLFASVLLGIAYKFYDDYFQVVLFMVLLLAISRYRLKMHSMSQIFAGLILGLTISIVIFNIWS